MHERGPTKPPKKPKPLDIDSLLEYAARSLGVRAQTTSELRDKLRRRAERKEDVDEVIGKLKEVGYLNDQRFAESFASWRRDNDGFGKTRVLRDLLARRVAPAVAKKATEEAYFESNETALIEQFLTRKYRGKNLGALMSSDNPEKEKHLASAYRKLRTAGFSMGNSIRVLKRYAADADRLEEMEETAE
jgi:regulatory protein